VLEGVAMLQSVEAVEKLIIVEWMKETGGVL
jgi:hypothetical protein